MKYKIEYLLSYLSYTLRKKPRLSTLMLYGAFIIICYFIIFVNNNKIYLNVAGWDNIIFLDGIHRVFYDQTPHIDFTTGLGAFNFWIPGLLHIFTNNEVVTFLYFKLFIVIYITIITIYLVYTRLNAFFSYLVVLLLVLESSIPLLGHYSNYWIGDAMYYNRFGWAMYSSFLLMYLPNKKKNKTDIFIIFTLLIFSFYIKITYFFSILLLLMIFTFMQRSNRLSYLYGFFLFLLFATMIEIMFPGIHKKYFYSLWEMKLSSEHHLIAKLYNTFSQSLTYVLISLFLLLTILYTKVKDINDWYKYIFLYFIILITSFGLAFNNASKIISCSLFIVLVIIFSLTEENKIRNFYISKESNFIIILLFLILSIPYIYDKLYVSYIYFKKLHSFNPYYYRLTKTEFDKLNSIIMDEGYLGDLPSLSKGESIKVSLHKIELANRFPASKQDHYQIRYMFSVVTGARILKKVMKKYGQGTVLNLDFSNPFPFVLDLKPVYNDYLWYHKNRNITRKIHPNYKRLFQYVDYVTKPTLTDHELAGDLLWDIYGKNIRKDYILVSKTLLWEIWKRKGL